MFDTVIVLTGPFEAPVLAAALRGHNPRLNVCQAAGLAELDALDRQVLARARLIAFATPVVVPRRILDALGYGAYNFHPGPPEYPGWAPSHFAIYEGAAEFGATAHVMIERVDAGPIIAAERFAVAPGTTVHRLQETAYAALARLFWQLAREMATRHEPFAETALRWSGRRRTRKAYAAMCALPEGISKDELDRRLAVFGRGDFGITLSLMLHGHRFRHCAADAAGSADAPGLVPEPGSAEPSRPLVQSSGNAMVLSSASAG